MALGSGRSMRGKSDLVTKAWTFKVKFEVHIFNLGDVVM